LLIILKSYFRNAAKYYPKPEDARKTTYFSPIGWDFIHFSTFAIYKLQPTSPLFSQHENLLQSLTTSLQDLHDDLAARPPPDYLFFASLLYVLFLIRFGAHEEMFRTDIGQNLILAILQYHTQVIQLRKDIEEEFYNTNGTFEQDWPEFVRLSKDYGVVLPVPAAPPPTDFSLFEGANTQEGPFQPSADAIVDVRVKPLGERGLQDGISARSSLKTEGDDATA